MKYISALVLVALLGVPEETQAIRLNARDDLITGLMEDISKDMEKEETPAAAKETPAKKNKTEDKKLAKSDNATKKSFSDNTTKKSFSDNTTKKSFAKKTVKKEVKAEDQDIPMDAAAIKAYSSVIADAAEESEPTEKVVYTETMTEEPKSSEPVGFDPMGSMLQNEISSIKEASVKAAADKADE